MTPIILGVGRQVKRKKPDKRMTKVCVSPKTMDKQEENDDHLRAGVSVCVREREEDPFPT